MLKLLFQSLETEGRTFENKRRQDWSCKNVVGWAEGVRSVRKNDDRVNVVLVGRKKSL